MSAHGKYLEATATTGALAGDTADAIITVPAGKSYLFDFVAVSADASVNTVQLKAAGNDIWELLTNVTSEQTIDLESRYPRSLQVDEGETIVATVTTNEDVAKTVTLKVWVIEG